MEQMLKRVCGEVLLKANELQGIIKTRINSAMTENSFKHRVFVYGTLKKGQPNYCHFENKDNGKARYICKGSSSSKYPLIIATRFNLPFLLWAPDKGEVINGEIWEVDDEMFSFLDDFEGHPELYERDKVKIIVEKTATSPEAACKESKEDLPSELECWCYFLKKFPPSLLDRKRAYSWYDAYGDHNMQYIGEKELDISNGPASIYDALLAECENNLGNLSIEDD